MADRLTHHLFFVFALVKLFHHLKGHAAFLPHSYLLAEAHSKSYYFVFRLRLCHQPQWKCFEESCLCLMAKLHSLLLVLGLRSLFMFSYPWIPAESHPSSSLLSILYFLMHHQLRHLVLHRFVSSFLSLPHHPRCLPRLFTHHQSHLALQQSASKCL